MFTPLNGPVARVSRQLYKIDPCTPFSFPLQRLKPVIKHQHLCLRIVLDVSIPARERGPVAYAAVRYPPPTLEWTLIDCVMDVRLPARLS